MPGSTCSCIQGLHPHSDHDYHHRHHEHHEHLESILSLALCAVFYELSGLYRRSLMHFQPFDSAARATQLKPCGRATEGPEIRELPRAQRQRYVWFPSDM